MKVLFWDPGLSHLGWAVIEIGTARSRVLGSGVLGERNSERHWTERLDELASGILDVFERWLPDVAGYEDQSGVEVAMQRDGTGTNYSSRRLHEVCGMLRFAARCALDQALPCYCLQPRSIKVALLGKGHADATKDQVQRAVKVLFGVVGNQHECDAIAGAVAAGRAHRMELSKRQRSASVIH